MPLITNQSSPSVCSTETGTISQTVTRPTHLSDCSERSPITLLFPFIPSLLLHQAGQWRMFNRSVLHRYLSYNIAQKELRSLVSSYPVCPEKGLAFICEAVFKPSGTGAENNKLFTVTVMTGPRTVMFKINEKLYSNKKAQLLFRLKILFYRHSLHLSPLISDQHLFRFDFFLLFIYYLFIKDSRDK